MGIYEMRQQLFLATNVPDVTSSSNICTSCHRVPGRDFCSVQYSVIGYHSINNQLEF